MNLFKQWVVQISLYAMLVGCVKYVLLFASNKLQVECWSGVVFTLLTTVKSSKNDFRQLSPSLMQRQVHQQLQLTNTSITP